MDSKSIRVLPANRTQYPSLSFPNFGRSDVLSETWNIGMNFRDELMLELKIWETTLVLGEMNFIPICWV
jgi:hypothetical protein